MSILAAQLVRAIEDLDGQSSSEREFAEIAVRPVMVLLATLVGRRVLRELLSELATATNISELPAMTPKPSAIDELSLLEGRRVVTTPPWCRRVVVCGARAELELWDPIAGQFWPMCRPCLRGAGPLETRQLQLGETR